MHKKIKEMSNSDLERVQGGDWLKDVGDYLNGLASGFKSVFVPRKK